MVTKLFRGLTIATLLLLNSPAYSDEIQPAGSMPLSEIVKKIEDKRLGAVKKADLDDGRWEIKTITPGGDVVNFQIDPRTAAILRQNPDTERHADRPAAGDKPLSAIVAIIEKKEKTPISEIEFDDGVWKVELLSATDKTSFQLDPKTGEKVARR